MGARRTWEEIRSGVAAATVRVAGYPSDEKKIGQGVLVGVVTNSAGLLDPAREGFPPLLQWALPSWLYRGICGTAGDRSRA